MLRLGFPPNARARTHTPNHDVLNLKLFKCECMFKLGVFTMHTQMLVSILDDECYDMLFG